MANYVTLYVNANYDVNVHKLNLCNISVNLHVS